MVEEAPGSNFPKVPEQRGPVAEDSAHRNSDVDSKPWAKHHTLGWGVNQAAPGQEVLAAIKGLRPVGEISSFWGTPPENWLKTDGSTFDGTVYPELEDFLGSTTLPTVADPVVAGLTHAIRAKAGA